jgi:hypothetical protein
VKLGFREQGLELRHHRKSVLKIPPKKGFFMNENDSAAAASGGYKF